MSGPNVLPLSTEEKPAPVPHTGRAIHPAFYIASWIFFSNLTIIFNKWLLDTAGFKYPVILTCFHLIFATAATQILARTTSLLDSRKHVGMNGRMFLRAVVPIGLFYSASLVCSNLVYVYLSVAFIQMLKSASPVAVLFTSWMWGVADPSMRTLANILFIVFGVGLASYGEIDFKFIGFLFQLGGMSFEAIRVVMIQVLLQDEGGAQKMDPLVSLYYYAPVCAVTNSLVALVTEVPSFDMQDLHQTGIGVLLLNSAVAFLLNIASVCLIGKTSGLVMTLTGVLKNILLIATSVLIWQTQITTLQFIGYGIAMAGLVVYSTGLDQLKQSALGAVTWAKESWRSGSMEDSRLTPLMKRALLCGAVVFFSAFIAMGYYHWDTVAHLMGAQTVQVDAEGS